MTELDTFRIKKRSISGVFTLTVRTILLQVISFLGYFFITVFLERKEFGLFILISAIIDILGYFSDIGLAAALIQKKEKPSLKEIRSTFTIQQTLVLLVLILLFIFSPLIKSIYSLEKEGMILLYSFAFAFFCSSLKTIPSVLLERKLEFTKIVIPQLVETILFNFVVVILAWRGWGISSYSVAVLIRAISGTVLIYILAPWKIGLNFSFKVLKKLLKFGVPYQLNTLLAVVKDKFMILLLGGIIGREGIALVGWAEKWATMPLRYFLDNTVKVAFPAFARLQHDRLRLKIAIEKTLYFLSLIILPALIGISLVFQPLVKIIPRYLKWQPALIPLYLYSFASIWGGLAVFLTTIFNAIGKIKITFKLMIFWTVLTWIFTPFLAIKFGFLGVPLAVVLVNITSLIGIFILKNYVKINFFSQIKGPLSSSLLMMFLIVFIKKYISLTFLGILLMIIIGFFSYFMMIFILDKKRILKEVRFLITEIKAKTK